MRDALVVRLHAVLDVERTALLGADYGMLERIGREKETLVLQLPRTPATLTTPAAPTAQADRILARMRHNQALIAAALSGLRGTGTLAAGAGFLAYGEDGSRASIGGKRPGFERRA